MEPSRALLDRARKVIPGGVNIPVRAFKAVGGAVLLFALGAIEYRRSVRARAPSITSQQAHVD